jgi:ribosome-associated protein
MSPRFALVAVSRKGNISEGIKPTVKGEPTNVHEYTTLAVQAAADKKASDITTLDVGDILAVTDCFVICSGTNTRQVRTIVDEVERVLHEQAALKPRNVEGLDDASWVLLDYGMFVVHVFLEETRAFYELERLWSDVPHRTYEPAAAVS